MVQKVKDYTKGFLNRHKWLKAFLYWNGWPMVAVCIFILDIFIVVNLYIVTWIIGYIAAANMSTAQIANLVKYQAELRSFAQQVILSPGAAAAFAAALFLRVDSNHDLIPNKFETEDKKQPEQDKRQGSE